jgi:hypothetical protein
LEQLEIKECFCAQGAYLALMWLITLEEKMTVKQLADRQQKTVERGQKK